MPMLQECFSNVVDAVDVPDHLPAGWFEIATTLFPALTAPGVRRLREQVSGARSMSDEELERAVLAECLGRHDTRE